MATNAPQDDWHKTGLRLPKPLHHQLHEAAAAAGRSYNAEIVARLESTFADGGEGRGADLQARTERMLEETSERLQELSIRAKEAVLYHQMLDATVTPEQNEQLRSRILEVLAHAREAGSKEEYERRISEMLEPQKAVLILRKEDYKNVSQDVPPSLPTVTKIPAKRITRTPKPAASKSELTPAKPPRKS